MKTAWRFGLMLAMLLWAGAAKASQIVTVTDVMDHHDNVWDDDAGIWFLIPQDEYEDPCNWDEDHSPWHRTSNEDWGWTHDISASVPSDANGIESATLAIKAWDVDSGESEDDVILANGLYLGTLTGVDRDWETVTFTLPDSLLDDLWKNRELYVYMDIDQILELSGGYRVTLGSSTLTVKYITSGAASNTTAVYRFWSPVILSHFYTIDEAERDLLLAEYPYIWEYEGEAFNALAGAGNTGASPVYRFWSPTLCGHFYTIDEKEKESIIATYTKDIWTYEGIAFYAFDSEKDASGTLPVYRFWSESLGHHFFTIDETEKQWLMDNYSDVWEYECIAWYAYAPSQHDSDEATPSK
ncbi:MAG: hypothetical protein ACM3VT_04575 [Solirubrobacterales bacterium]